MYFQYSDDDCNTYSQLGAIPMSTDTKMFRLLGKFRTRTFEFLHVDQTPLRVHSLELTLSAGGQ